ncbi:MAG: hypothetical protein ACLR5G_03485 [Eubacteriales bacterium]
MFDELDPKGMISELCEAFPGVQTEIHYRDDDEYDYLVDDEVCVVFINPCGDNISVDLRGEFTLTCGGEEDVFFPDEEALRSSAKRYAGYSGNKTEQKRGAAAPPCFFIIFLLLRTSSAR